MCKMCEQLSLVTSYTSIYGANELKICSTPPRADGFVEAQCKTLSDVFDPHIKM